MSKILLFRGGALGDFILTFPAITALRRRWPDAYIELVGYRRYANLGMTAKLVNSVRSLDDARMAVYFQNTESLPENEKKYVRTFDLIVSYLHDPDGVLLRNLEEAGAKKLIAASPIVKENHAAEHFFAAIKDIVGDEIRKCPEVLLEWPQSLQEEARRRLSGEIGEKQTIIIHAGSGSPAKNWPAEKFAALAKKIRKETDFEPLIIGGEADDKAIAVMRPLLPGFQFLVNAPLMDVASILSAAGGFIGNDSGITHLAAALGIPVVALFGPTDPEIWTPRGKNVAIIKSSQATTESLAGIKVGDVFHALKKALSDVIPAKAVPIAKRIGMDSRAYSAEVSATGGLATKAGSRSGMTTARDT